MTRELRKPLTKEQLLGLIDSIKQKKNIAGDESLFLLARLVEWSHGIGIDEEGLEATAEDWSLCFPDFLNDGEAENFLRLVSPTDS